MTDALTLAAGVRLQPEVGAELAFQVSGDRAASSMLLWLPN